MLDSFECIFFAADRQSMLSIERCGETTKIDSIVSVEFLTFNDLLARFDHHMYSINRCRWYSENSDRFVHQDKTNHWQKNR